MKQTIKTMLAFVALMLCGGAWADAVSATPKLLINFVNNNDIAVDGWYKHYQNGGKYLGGESGITSGGFTFKTSADGNFYPGDSDPTQDYQNGSYVDIYGATHASLMEEVKTSLGLANDIGANVYKSGLINGGYNNHTATIGGLDPEKQYVVYCGFGRKYGSRYHGFKITTTGYTSVSKFEYVTTVAGTGTSVATQYTEFQPETQIRVGDNGLMIVRATGIVPTNEGTIVFKLDGSHAGMNFLAVAEVEDTFPGQFMYSNQLAGSETIPAGTYGAITIAESTGGYKATSFASQGTISGGTGSFASMITRASNGRVDTRTHTVAGWFKINSLDGLLYAAKTANTGDHVGYKVFVDSDGKINIGKVKWSSGGFAWNGNVMKTASACVTADTWHHIAIAVTKNGDDDNHTGGAKVFVDGSEVTMSTSPANFATNLDGENCTEIYMGAGVTVGGLYVDSRDISDAATIKSIATYPSLVRAVNSVFKATLTTDTNYCAISWDKGEAPAAGDAAEITLGANVMLTLDEAIAADSVKIVGENKDIALAGSSLDATNFAKLDFTGFGGKIIFRGTDFVPAQPPSAGMTYRFEGTTAITSIPYASVVVAGTVEIARPVNASGTLGFDRTKNKVILESDITAEVLQTGNQDNSPQTFTQNSGTITLTKSANDVTSTSSAAVLIGHWKNSKVTYNLVGGSIVAENGPVSPGWDSAMEMTIGGGDTTAKLRARQFKSWDTSWGHRNNTMTITVSSNGSLEVGAGGMNLTSSKSIILNGGTFKAYGTSTIEVGGGISLQSDSTIEVDSNQTMTIASTLSGSGAIAKTGTGALILGVNRPKMSAFAGQLGLTLTAEEFAAGKIALPVSSDISSSFSTTSVTILKPNGTDAATWATENPITYNSETGAVELKLAAIAPITVDTADKSFSAAIGDATAGVLAINGTDSDATAFTVTVDCALPDGVSVVVSGHVKFVATEGNTVPFETMTYNEGATITLPSVADYTIPSGVTMNVGTLSGTITNNGTLNVTETCSFKLINTGTITIKDGANATIDANDQSISGTVIVEHGATFTNARSTDAITYNGTVNVHVYGTLAFGSTRWTFGANSSLYLYTGATVTGAGDGGNGALDFNGGNGNIYVKPNGSTTGTVTCSAPMRNRQGGTITVDQNMVFETTGNLINYSNGSPTKVGAGTWVVKGGTYSSGATVNAGTLKLVGINPGNTITMGDGTLELAQNANGDDYAFTGTITPSQARQGTVKVCEGSTVSLSATFTEAVASIDATAANAKFVIPSEKAAKTLQASGAIEVNGVLEFTNNSTLDPSEVNWTGITGSGTIKFSGSAWRSLPYNENMFASTLALNHVGTAELIVASANTEADPSITTVGTLSGSGNFRSDWTGKDGDKKRCLKVVQAADSEWGGVFNNGDRMKGLIVAGANGVTAKTLTLSGTQTHTNDLTIEASGSAKLTGMWIATTTTVNGRLEVMNSATLTSPTLTYTGKMTTENSGIYYGSDEIASAEAEAKIVVDDETTYYETVQAAIDAAGDDGLDSIVVLDPETAELPDGYALDTDNHIVVAVARMDFTYQGVPVYAYVATLPQAFTPFGGTVTLLKDVTVASTISVAAFNGTLDMNGHIIIGDNVASVIDLANGSTLHINDTDSATASKVINNGGYAIRNSGSLVFDWIDDIVGTIKTIGGGTNTTITQFSSNAGVTWNPTTAFDIEIDSTSTAVAKTPYVNLPSDQLSAFNVNSYKLKVTQSGTIWFDITSASLSAEFTQYKITWIGYAAPVAIGGTTDASVIDLTNVTEVPGIGSYAKVGTPVTFKVTPNVGYVVQDVMYQYNDGSVAEAEERYENAEYDAETGIYTIPAPTDSTTLNIRVRTAATVAKIEDVSYPSIAAAMDDAEEGDTIELVANETAALTLTKNITIDVASDRTITGTITGAYSITKTGTGALTLSSTSNTFSGGLNVHEGTVKTSADNVLGTGMITVDDDATLNIVNHQKTTGDGGYDVTLNGGTLKHELTAGGADTKFIHSITVPAGKTGYVTGNVIGIGANGAATSLTLNGNLEVNLSSGNFYLRNTTVSGTGTLTMAGGNLLIYGTACSMPDSSFVLKTGASVEIQQDLSIKNVELAGGTVDCGTKRLTVKGTLSKAADVTATIKYLTLGDQAHVDVSNGPISISANDQYASPFNTSWKLWFDNVPTEGAVAFVCASQPPSMPGAIGIQGESDNGYCYTKAVDGSVQFWVAAGSQPIVTPEDAAEPTEITNVGAQGVTIAPNANVKVPVGTDESKIAVKFTANGTTTDLKGGNFVTVEVDDNGLVTVTPTDNAKPAATAITMATPTVEAQDKVAFTITSPIPGLFYAVSSCDTPDGTFVTPQGVVGDQATTSAEAKTVSIPMTFTDGKKVKYYKVSVKATK